VQWRLTRRAAHNRPAQSPGLDLPIAWFDIGVARKREPHQGMGNEELVCSARNPKLSLTLPFLNRQDRSAAADDRGVG
jgi:hypothetical protein